MVSLTIHDFKGTLFLGRVYGLKSTLNFKGTKNKRETWLGNASGRKRDNSERILDNSIEFFVVWNELHELSIYIDNSTLIHEKLGGQVAHVLNRVQKYFKLRTKLF